MSWHKEYFELESGNFLENFRKKSFYKKAKFLRLMREYQLDLPTVLNCHMLAKDPTCYLQGFKKVKDEKHENTRRNKR